MQVRIATKREIVMKKFLALALVSLSRSLLWLSSPRLRLPSRPRP
jgi:hypothetical protein